MEKENQLWQTQASEECRIIIEAFKRSAQKKQMPKEARTKALCVLLSIEREALRREVRELRKLILRRHKKQVQRPLERIKKADGL